MKKLFTIFMVTLLLAQTILINAYAIDESGPKGALEHDESYRGSQIVYTEKQKNMLEEKHRLLEEFEQNKVSTYAYTWSFLDYFTIYVQETNYYCGPATVKSVLNYINGSAPSQSTIATNCNTTSSGTYLADMINYLNNKQSVNVYEGAYRVDQTKLARYLYFDVHNRGIPCIIGFACNTTNGWQYDSGGHFCCVIGARDDRGAFTLADPYTGYLGYGVPAYDKSVNDLFYAYNSVNIGFCW